MGSSCSRWFLKYETEHGHHPECTVYAIEYVAWLGCLFKDFVSGLH